MKFKGSIIITDPCYIVKNDDWDKHLDSICFDGGDLSCIGFENSLCHDTLYGDWSCTTYKCRFEHLDVIKTKGALPFEYGEFCADAGMVCICLVEDVLKYNPDFFKEYGTWCYTIIPDFDGDVRFEIVNDNLHVVGEGNKPFLTIQTGA